MIGPKISRASIGPPAYGFNHTQTFWQFSFAVVPGQVLISSLLKNSFGLSFRGALRHGISLFVGFWRGGILYSVRDGVFRGLFQQPVSRVIGNLNSHVRFRRFSGTGEIIGLYLGYSSAHGRTSPSTSGHLRGIAEPHRTRRPRAPW